MAKLTKADAARQLGISRRTLYKLIDQGKVSATPDGFVDDAELVRAPPLLDVHGERPRGEQVRRPQSTDDECQDNVHLCGAFGHVTYTAGHHALRVGGGPCRPLGRTCRTRAPALDALGHAASV